jgi:hypothetical protein
LWGSFAEVPVAVAVSEPREEELQDSVAVAVAPGAWESRTTEESKRK